MISMKEAYWTERRRAEKAEADLADCTQKLFIETEGCAWAVALCDLLEGERDMLREAPAQLLVRVDRLIKEARTEETREFWRTFRGFLDVALERDKG